MNLAIQEIKNLNNIDEINRDPSIPQQAYR
jgi:hypothetical protein